VALALMETLADYGVGAYFGLTTFSTGIYKAWLVMNDRTAAAQLAAGAAGGGGAAAGPNARAAPLRFAGSRNAAGIGRRPPAAAARCAGGGAGLLLCALPVLLGFVLPVAWLAAHAVAGGANAELGLPLARFAGWAWSSFQPGRRGAAGHAAGAGAGLCAAPGVAPAAFSLLRGGGARAVAGLRRAGRGDRRGHPAAGGLAAAALARGPIGRAGTGTVAGLMYAYLVRFSAVALQSVEAGYARVPPSIDETARMLGAGPWRIFVQLHLPLLRARRWRRRCWSSWT
jgi:iron(III) transport system permease protein